jgi:hypothetical protein
MNDIERYRDDGNVIPLLGLRIPVPPLLLVLVGAIPLGVAIAVTGDDASKGVIVGAVAWFIVWGNVSRAAPHTDPVRWAVPPALRVVEYSTVIWIAANAGDSSLPAAFAFLSVLAFRHYDLVYRLRHQGVAPPDWIGFGGWDGRMFAVLVMYGVDLLPAGLFVAAGVLAVVLVTDSALSWRAFTRKAGEAGLYDDEEDEIQ